MADVGRIDIKKLMSYGDDLVEVLKNKKDVNNLMQSLEGAKTLRTSCEVDFHEVKFSFEEYQKKINACKQRIHAANTEVLSDKDLDSLENELEEELQKEGSLMEELRIANEQIQDLECQRLTIEDQKKMLKQCEKDELRAQKKLSMYASVTNIIPNIDDKTKTSGNILERNKKLVEAFEFDPSNAAPIDICNSLWKAMDM